MLLASRTVAMRQQAPTAPRCLEVTVSDMNMYVPTMKHQESEAQEEHSFPTVRYHYETVGYDTARHPLDTLWGPGTETQHAQLE